MAPQPLYELRDQTPAYQLRYTWCGWPSVAAFPTLTGDAWQELTTAWETDGLRLLEREVLGDRILLTFSTLPNVSPVHLATRAKGRLQNSLRQSDATWSGFSRKVAVRSVGDNTTEAVQHYIASQISSADFVDSRFAEFLKQFTVSDEAIDLSIPTESKRGRYWYNLHIVLVTDG
jgi:REP element-mobilizing transposase RayT